MRMLLNWLIYIFSRYMAPIDKVLLLALLAIQAVSLIVLTSAGGGSLQLVVSQSARFAVGLVILVFLANISPLKLRQWAPLVFVLSLLLLGSVFLFGSGRSANLWLDLGFIYIQPGELLKLSVPLMLAWYLHRRVLPPSWLDLLTCAVIIGIPVALIVLQPDLGTGLLVAASGAFALFLAGLQWSRILFFAGAGIASLPVAWQFLATYQKERILTFLDPESDPLRSGWNIIQSKIAIGSGGWFGKGWGDGSQSKLDFLPEQTTDFVFAVFSEEFGWFGVLILMGLYLLVIARSLWLSTNARDTFGRIVENWPEYCCTNGLRLNNSSMSIR